MKRTIQPKKLDLMLDSGAFSAYTKGKEINLEEYMAYIDTYREYLTGYINLDVIGDAVATERNQHIMESAGFNPMPVFHIGEDFSYLKKMLDKYEYVGIGGIANLSGSTESFKFLNQVFDFACDPSGLPRNRLHAFGITNTQAMMNYPWYSVDSTSWLYSSRMGLLYLPRILPSGEWDFLETTGKYFKPSITPLSPVRGKPMAHLNTYGPYVQKLYDQWIEYNGWKHGISNFIKVGAGYALKKGERWATRQQSLALDPKAGKHEWVEQIIEVGLSNDYTSRDIANTHYFLEFQKHLPKYPWHWKRPKIRGLGLALSGHSHWENAEISVPTIDRMKLYMSTWLIADQSYSLTRAGANERLTSFFFHDMATPEQTRKYMEGQMLPFKPQQAMEDSNAG